MGKLKTKHNSDLYMDIKKVHYIGEKYVKCKVLFFYKSNKNICYWLNPEGKTKSFKLIKSVYDSLEDYNE